MIRSKFGQAGNCRTTDNIKQSSHRSPWKGIAQVLPTFLPFTKYLLASGNSIRFWINPWISSTSLGSRFPRLFNLSQLKDGLVSCFFSSPSNWNLHLRRNLRESEFKNLWIYQIFSNTLSLLPLVMTPEFGPFPLPVPLPHPHSSLPSPLTLLPLLSLVSLFGSPLLLPKLKAPSGKLHGVVILP